MSNGGISNSVPWSVRTPAIVCSVIYLLEIPPDLEICDEAGDILEHNDNQDMSKHLVIAEAQSN